MKNVINRALVAKKKVIFTLMLTLVSSVWMTSEAAWCMPKAQENIYQQWISVHGVIQETAYPCEPEEECPTCLTIALQANDMLYYLTAENEAVEGQLDALHQGAQVTISGTPYKWGSFDYIRVGSIDTTPLRLNSLCDEWNVLEHNMSLGPKYENFNTLHFRLTSDTIINEMRYVKFEQDGIYKGALREGTNADIYYVPNLSTHEYLLYAFNAQVGDSLENLWFGANENENYFVSSATVVNIEPTTPRKFIIDFEWQLIFHGSAKNDTSEITHTELVWLEGLGFQYGGPLNYECPFDCSGAPGRLILCAYKNGEHIYTSEWGEQYGCEYNKKPLNSLCDEWNVLTTAIYENGTRYFTFTQKLTTDTIIGENMYVKSEVEHKYNGAYREGENRDIYFVPAAMNKEFLVYAWNAQVGDTLYNILVSSYPMYALQYSDKAVVREIKETTPRTFIVDYEYIYNRKIDSADTIWWEYQWIEGIGMTCGPSGDLCPFDKCRDSIKSDLLCAYKNGEHIYTSPKGQQYGCEYNSIEYIEYADTIPLYAQDDPGSSTVDPVDPNQVVVTLKGDNMTVKESSGDEISMELTYITKNAPSERHTAETETFTNSVSVKLTEEGAYTITLTNPKWNYKVSGKFDYPKKHEGIEETQSDNEPCTKVLRNGQLLIRRGNKLYNLQGAVITE